MYTRAIDAGSGTSRAEALFHTHGLIGRLGLSLLFALFTGICAQLRLYLPFTPVPVTGQVFAVLLSGVVLGKKYGPLSQLFYLLFGIVGVPWFVIGPIGPTGGYIVGFIVAPYLIGELYERSRSRGKPTESSGPHTVAWFETMAIMLAGIAVIYLLGLVQFSMFTGTGPLESIRYAVLPFIPFDVAKTLLAAAVARTLIG